MQAAEAAPGWDPRLITPARALELAGRHPVYATFELARLSQFETDGYAPAGAGADGRLPDQWQINVRCGLPGTAGQPCGQSAGMLGSAGQTVMTTVEELLSGVLRHLVMAHDVPLSGARTQPGPCAGPQCDHVSHQGKVNDHGR